MRIEAAPAWRGALYLRTGPFMVRLDTPIAALREEIASLYEGHPISRHGAFADFHLTLAPSAGLRRWYHPQIRFSIDGHEPFRPLPLDQSLPMFEWGLNWCVGNLANRFLVIHAAAIERNGRAVIMPGSPGSGKSTLTAGLAHRGWRLLSDELTLLSLTDGTISALARPISLKNESIDVIRAFAPDAVFSRMVHGTAKGTVALVKAPPASIARVGEPARPSWIIFPKYVGGLPAVLEPKPRSAIFIEIAKNAFNYSLLGGRGFTVLADAVGACACYKFTYADMNEAIDIFDRLDSFGSTDRNY